MLVNITIFGDGVFMNEMVGALNAALLEMRPKYCDSDYAVVDRKVPVDENKCYSEEIGTAGEWM